jgi:O-antigen ligase
LAPSVRLLAWIEAIQNFLQHPLLGRGIGIEAVKVVYQQENLCSGVCVTDAHNTFLNFAVQTGVVGLGALLGITAFVSSKLKSRPLGRGADPVTFGLSIAWLSGFALQGLVGSFEDARHLWITLGLILSASTGVNESERPNWRGY